MRYTARRILYCVGRNDGHKQEATMFKNYLTQTNEVECVECKESRWYIRMGFAGFNSPANNRFGYATKATAEAACLRYQNKSK